MNDSIGDMARRQQIPDGPMITVLLAIAVALLLLEKIIP